MNFPIIKKYKICSNKSRVIADNKTTIVYKDFDNVNKYATLLRFK